jgi:alginate O-acetyltransferase complex protein AlgI
METLKKYFDYIFFYHHDAPLIFTRLYFWVFFAVVLTFYTFLYKRKLLRSTYLFLVSLFFYYKTSGFYFFLLIFSTLVDYFIGHGLYKEKSETKRKILVATSVMINLSVLFYFKYAYLLIDIINTILGTNFVVKDVLAESINNLLHLHLDVTSIFLPVGISFYTFQTISYSVDIYRRKIKPLDNILDFGFYVSFFPQLVAGPIVRASEFIPQIKADYKLSKNDFGLALFFILNGLFKKMVLADYIAVNFVDRVFANPVSYSGVENLFALIGYSLQVYADFSGYTDMATGVALLMGFRLPKNFNYPYKAKNVGEFWKRWHISLSSWLKDYLYIPLGGNRRGTLASYLIGTVVLIIILFLAKNPLVTYITIGGVVLFFILARVSVAFKKWVNTNINLMLTMLLGGLWHGAHLKFVVWGGLNGLGLVVYKLWKKISPYENKNHFLINIWRVAITFAFISFTRAWFRADSMEKANEVISQIISQFNPSVFPAFLVGFKTVLLVMLFGYVLHWLPDNWKDYIQQKFVTSPLSVQLVVVVISVVLIYQTRIADLQPFIYFQF